MKHFIPYYMRVTGLGLLSLLNSCTSKLNVLTAGGSCAGDKATSAECSEGAVNTTTTETKSQKAIDPLIAPGDPVGFSISAADPSAATLTWAKAPSGGLAPLTQKVLLYSNDTTNCSGQPTSELTASIDAVTAEWNRFTAGLAGFVSFRVEVSDAAGTKSQSACSGAIRLRNGMLTLSGPLAGLGLKFRTAVDMNGDGIQDFVATNETYDSNRGTVVVFASNARLAGQFTPYVYVGEYAGDKLGYFMKIQDVTGDGKPELIFTHHEATVGANIFAGSMYIVLGGTNLSPGGPISTAGRRYDGEAAGVVFATHMYVDYDINNDGIKDIITSNNNSSPYGAVYMILGAATLPASGLATTVARKYTGVNGVHNNFGQLLAIDDVTGDGIVDIVTVDYMSWGAGVSRGCMGFIAGATTMPASGAINVVGKSYCSVTNSAMLAPALFRDFNNDGIKDIVVTYSGAADVFLGRSAASMPATGSTFPTIASRHYTGFSGYPSVSEGDLNGDGIADLVIDDSAASPSGISAAGSSYIILGAAALPASAAITTAANRRYNGEFINDRLSLGSSCANGINPFVDINGDGYLDLVCAREAAYPGNRALAGSVFFLPGGATLPASAAISTAGRRYDGDVANEQIKIAVMVDMTGDGRKDLVVRSLNYAYGKVQVLVAAAVMPASGALSSTAFTYTGTAAAVIGTSFDDTSVTADINNDGKADLFLRGADVSGLTNAGSVCILQGSSPMPTSGTLVSVNAKCFVGTAAGEKFNFTSILDVNGDSMPDIGIVRDLTDPKANLGQIIYGQTDIQNIELTTIAQPDWGDSSNSNTGVYLQDLDGDGNAEVYWSVPSESLNGVTGGGAIYFMPASMVYPKAAPN